MKKLPFQTSKDLMGSLIKSSVELCSNYDSSKRLYNQSRYNIVTERLLNQSLFRFDQKEVMRIAQSNKIRVFSYFSHPLIRLSVYYIPFNQIMMLHDHPGMCVMSTVIKGSLQAQLYRKIQLKNEERNSNNQLSEGSQIYEKNQKLLEVGQLQLIDNQYTGRMQETDPNTPESSFDLHQFKSISPEGSFFVDILFPEYEDGVRDCTYYQEASQVKSSSDTKFVRLTALPDHVVEMIDF